MCVRGWVERGRLSVIMLVGVEDMVAEIIGRMVKASGFTWGAIRISQVMFGLEGRESWRYNFGTCGGWGR